MKYRAINNIQEYDSLIQRLNPRGHYQLRLYLLCFISWAFAGLTKTIFQECFQKQTQESMECPYALMFFQAFGIIFFSWLSMSKGRKISSFLSSCGAIGGILMIICFFSFQVKIIGFIGTSIVGGCMYAQPFLLLTLICEYTKPKYMPLILSISLISFCCAKIGGIFIIGEGHSQRHAVYYILIPINVLGMILCKFILESPRFLNNRDAFKLEETINKILRMNRCPEQNSGDLEDSFLWDKLNMKKYSLKYLFRYQSLSLPQFSSAGCFFLLGMISKYPLYFLSLNLEPHSSYFTPDLVIQWIGSFQIAGLLAAIFCMKVYRRKIISIAMAIALFSISCMLLVWRQKSVIFDLTLLALNTFFCIMLYAVLTINILQFYPHSVRILGAGVVMSFYYLGQLLFYLYLYIGIQTHEVIQFFCFASIVLGIYTFGLEETLYQGFKYEIKEIQQEQQQQF